MSAQVVSASAARERVIARLGGWPKSKRIVMQQLLLFAALAGAFLVLDRYYRIGFNTSASVPYRVVLIERGTLPKKDDLVVFAYRGARGLGLSQGEWIVKQVAGVTGDVVVVGGASGRFVMVSRRPVGEAKRASKKGEALTPIAPGAVPPGYYFVAGTHADSFDSRYAEQGLISTRDVVGVAHPWF